MWRLTCFEQTNIIHASTRHNVQILLVDDERCVLCSIPTCTIKLYATCDIDCINTLRYHAMAIELLERCVEDCMFMLFMSGAKSHICIHRFLFKDPMNIYDDGNMFAQATCI